METREAAAVAPGKAAVAVPASARWIVAQLVYDDPGAVHSLATSGHVKIEAAGVAASGRGRTGGGEKRDR